MKFESWKDYAAYCKSIYFDFEDDKSWLAHISSPQIIDEPQLLDNLCIGTPGVYCIQENEDIDCNQCLLENIDRLKRMLYMNDIKRDIVC